MPPQTAGAERQQSATISPSTAVKISQFVDSSVRIEPGQNGTVDFRIPGMAMTPNAAGVEAGFKPGSPAFRFAPNVDKNYGPLLTIEPNYDAMKAVTVGGRTFVELPFESKDRLGTNDKGVLRMSVGADGKITPTEFRFDYSDRQALAPKDQVVMTYSPAAEFNRERFGVGSPVDPKGLGNQPPVDPKAGLGAPGFDPKRLPAERLPSTGGLDSSIPFTTERAQAVNEWAVRNKSSISNWNTITDQEVARVKEELKDILGIPPEKQIKIGFRNNTTYVSDATGDVVWQQPFPAGVSFGVFSDPKRPDPK